MATSATKRPISEAAGKLLSRGSEVLTALEPINGLGKTAPEAARAAVGNLSREMERMRARLGGGRVEVGLFGLPKAGKSTLLNALAGRLVSAVDVLPETAFPIYLIPASESGESGNGSGLKCKVFFHPNLNKAPIELPAEELGKITREKSIWNPKDVAFAEVPSRTEVLAPGFCFIDTPGLEEFVADYGDSSDRLLNDETDAAVLVATPDQCMRDSVRKFLELATRRCPRLWIALNADITASGLNPDGTRAELGTAEFDRLRRRFRERLADIRGLEQMAKDGSASIHIFSAKVAADKRFGGATVEALAGDPACKDFSEMAAAARRYADDPAREAHAVKFWQRRLREFTIECAGAIDKAADREEAAFKATKDRFLEMQASRDHQLKLESQLKEVLDAGVAESTDTFKAAALDALMPFFATPLRQAVSGWYRSAESLNTLHENVKTALRGEFESARMKLRTVASERAAKLAATMPDLAGEKAPEPTWVHPTITDDPPPALVGDLAQLPKWIGRLAGLVFFLTFGIAAFFLIQILSLVFDHTMGWGLAGLLIGTVAVSWFVRTWMKNQLLTRKWGGWTKKFFLPGDTEHIRALYEDYLRGYAAEEVGSAVRWLKDFAASLLAKKSKPEPAELSELRGKVAAEQAKVDTLRKTAKDLRARAEAE